MWGHVLGARRPRVDRGSRGAPERRAGGADPSERPDGSVKDGPGKNWRGPSGECRARRAREGPPTAPPPALVFSYSPPINDAAVGGTPKMRLQVSSSSSGTWRHQSTNCQLSWCDASSFREGMCFPRDTRCSSGAPPRAGARRVAYEGRHCDHNARPTTCIKWPRVRGEQSSSFRAFGGAGEE